MITITSHPTEPFGLHTSIDGFAVYLDLFAIKELAKGDPARRNRFIATANRGAEVLFSVATAAELSGPQGASFDKMRSFVDEIGPRWFPVELTPRVAVDRENEGKSPSECCVCEDLLKSFTASRIRDIPVTQVVRFSGNFFRLGAFMDWLAPQRDSIAASKLEMYRTLDRQIKEHRAKHDADPNWLKTVFPELRFRRDCPATFAYVNLVRMLILETKQFKLKKGDGMDFCQAVIGAAFASVATVDKHWKRRIDALPQPNGIATVYCSPHLDEMVDEIERNLDVLEERKKRAALVTNSL